MLQNAPDCTIKKNFGEACPRTPLANACLYALQNLFKGQKMTKILAQHILKCITWALFSNTM